MSRDKKSNYVSCESGGGARTRAEGKRSPPARCEMCPVQPGETSHTFLMTLNFKGTHLFVKSVVNLQNKNCNILWTFKGSARKYSPLNY